MMSKLVTSLLAAVLGLSMMSCGGDEEDTGGATLAAPTGLTAMPLPGPAVHLTWSNIENEHHYSIERKEGAGTFAELSTTVLNITQYHDAAVESGKTYTYRVAGSLADLKKGPFSAEVSATVP